MVRGVGLMLMPITMASTPRIMRLWNTGRQAKRFGLKTIGDLASRPRALRARWPNLESVEISDATSPNELALARVLASRVDAIVAGVNIQELDPEDQSVGLGGLPLWSHLRHSPVDPEGVLFRSLDENLQERAQAVEAVRRRRTTYASDRRADGGSDSAGAPVPLTLARTRYASDRKEAKESA